MNSASMVRENVTYLYLPLKHSNNAETDGLLLHTSLMQLAGLQDRRTHVSPLVVIPNVEKHGHSG